MASTTLSPSRQATTHVVRLVTVGFVGITYFVVILIALHVLRPDLNPIQRPTSEYAVGPYGWLMNSAFLGMSVASFALVLGLAHGLSQPARSWTGLGLLGAWAVGVLIAMLFPIDANGAPQTLAGTIHRINGPLAFLSLTAGAILVSRRVKHDAKWRPVHRSALVLSLVMLALFVGTFLSIATDSGSTGLCQRMYLATFVLWFFLTAARLRAVAGGRDTR